MNKLFDTADFPARWHCGAWSEAHGWTHIISDLLIFGAYMAIPVAIAWFVLRRPDMHHPRLYWLFALFIGSCGLGHLIEATIFWQPWYRFSGFVKVITAAASWATVVAVVKVMPLAMRMPGALQLNETLAREVEERKRAEAEVRRLNEALLHRVEELETLLEVMPVPVGIALDRECRVIRGNRALSRMLEVPSGGNASLTAEAGAAPTHFKVMKDGRELSEDELPIQRAAKHDEVIREFEEEIVFDDGRRSHVLAHAAPLHDAAGNVRGAVGAFFDITGRKEAERERQMIEGKLRETQKLESLGVLAGGVAHDFNNLLTGVIGNASMARMECPPGAAAVPYLEQIEISALRAADLCRQLLAYAGKGRFVIEPLDVSVIVRETTHLLQSSIRKGITLNYDLQEPLPAVEADATQLRQVIMNLVINASESIEGDTGFVHLQTRRVHADRHHLDHTLKEPDLIAGDYVSLQVSDSGCGMSKETLAKIFDPFFTTKFTGRGLGLAAVQGIIRAHRGSIRVYSEPGKGSSFKILLPITTAAVMARPITGGGGAEWDASGTVLLVDDDALVRSTAKRMLERVGFEVIEARNGHEATDLFRHRHGEITAVLLDLTMPGMDGEETFRQLRRIQPEVRVLLMSGFSEQEAVRRFVGRGLAGFAQKPFTMEGLMARLRVVLESPPSPGTVS